MDFSVSICVYDKDNPLYFKEALDSLIKQKLPPSQIVITVDGPINESLENVIEKFEQISLDSGVELNIVRLKENMGHGEARRVGIESCRYDYIAIADADDINDFDRFYEQTQFFKNHKDVSVVGSQMLEIQHDTKKVVAKKIVPLSNDEISQYIKSRCPMNQATVMFKKDDVLKAGGYIDFFHNEDYYLWIRMFLNDAKFYNIDKTLVYVRVNNDYFNRRGGWNYFKSEYNIQKILFKNNIISFLRFILNVSIRFVIQILLTDKMRGFIFKKLFRKKGE
jgi:glycosyltransferase involved in cell wall biosynthesis